MFSSANTSLVHSTDDLCVALNSADFPLVGRTMARIVLIMGEIALLQFAARLLERAVSLFVFLLGALADCVPCSGSGLQVIMSSMIR